MPSWKEVTGIVGYILLFGLIAFNLYEGSGIFISIFKGVVAFLVFSILNTIAINIVHRQVSNYEYDRVLRLNKIEEEEEQRRMKREEEERGAEEES
jgi:membrane protein implicated in regulation of membrane protease activity